MAAGTTGSLDPSRWNPSTGSTVLPNVNPGSPFPASGNATAASQNGSFIVGYQNVDFGSISENQVVRWTPSGPQNLGDLGASGIASNKFSRAHGISGDGSVVVGETTSPTGRQAFRWTSAGMIGLGKLNASDPSSKAYDVSNNGQVVVGNSILTGNAGEVGFRWTQAGGMVAIPDLPGGLVQSTALAVSGDGTTVVGRGSSAASHASGTFFFEAYRWDAVNGLLGLGDLPGGDFYSTANGVSGNGSRIVGWSRAADGPNAYIWDATNGMRDLQDVLASDYGLSLPGWWLTSADSISDDGNSISGRGIDPFGQQRGWVVNLVPEPIGLAPLVLGFTLLKRRRHSRPPR